MSLTVSPELAPSDFNLFPTLKEFLGGKRFRINEGAKDTAISG